MDHKFYTTYRRIAFCLVFVLLFMSFPVQLFADDIISKNENKKTTIGEIGGYLEGALHSVHNLYNEANFHYAQGHGFAAETANNLSDRLHGLTATVVGGDNVKNGPDRKIVDSKGNVIWIQDKYYQTAKESLNAAFDDSTSLFKYIDADGKPMQLEVPADQYDEVVSLYKEKITEGKVPGVTDPDQASSLVRKGKYTYNQAKNLTKAGNIDSLKYDATNGVIMATCAMGITFVLDYVSCVMNGQDPTDALKESGINALKTGSFVFATYVISSQLCKTGLTTALAPATDAVANALGEGLSKAIIETFGVSSAGLSSAQIAARVSKILQSQIIVQGVIVVALTVPDIIDLFRGRISAEQLLKNLTVVVMSSIGGAGGAVAGSALGTAVLPGAGTVIGGIIGGIAGSAGAGVITEWAVSKYLKDDSEEMYEIIQAEFQTLASDYLLSQEEADKVVDSVQKSLTGSVLKDMYASEDRALFARELMNPCFEEQIKCRMRIVVPSEERVRSAMLSDLNGIVFLH